MHNKSMQIQNITLFISSTSNECSIPFRFVQDSHLPISIVRLDTERDRRRATTGKYLKIDTVPSLAVVFNDGKLQLFVGNEKIIPYLRSLINTQTPPQEAPIIQTFVENDIPRKRKKGKKKNKKEKITHVGNNDDNVEFIDIPAPVAEGSGLMTGPAAPRPKEKMNDVKSIAAKMKADMAATVMGYKED